MTKTLIFPERERPTCLPCSYSILLLTQRSKHISVAINTSFFWQNISSILKVEGAISIRSSHHESSTVSPVSLHLVSRDTARLCLRRSSPDISHPSPVIMNKQCQPRKNEKKGHAPWEYGCPLVYLLATRHPPR